MRQGNFLHHVDFLNKMILFLAIVCINISMCIHTHTVCVKKLLVHYFVLHLVLPGDSKRKSDVEDHVKTLTFARAQKFTST